MFVDAAPHDGPQSKTLAVFTLLSHLRPEWGGALILSCGLGPLGSAVALAANVAGAACLSIEPDSVLCRAAMRAGACDFLVNTVDEALRVLKNEVRQRRPLSVALEADTSTALDELFERGVLPQLFTGADSTDAATFRQFTGTLQPHGMSFLDLDDALRQLPSRLEQEGLALYTSTFDTAASLKVFDARLKGVIPEGDPRRPWLLAAPRLFHRALPYSRSILLIPEELAALGQGIP